MNLGNLVWWCWQWWRWEIDEEDETGTTWLERFGTYYGTWDIDKGGFGEYKFDDDGNIIFDTNNNGIYDDNWRSDGIDNDEDGTIDENDEADFVMNYGGLPKLKYDANDDGIDDFQTLM